MSNFNTRIKLKRDTAVNWTVNNPVLLNGEIILIDTDSGELRAKVGDGTKTYTQLPFTDEILRNLITNKQDKNNAVSIEKGAQMIISESIGSGPFTIEIDEDEDSEISAIQIGYNNSTTGMASTNVQDAVTELFTSVSEGKSLIAAAVTDKGVETAADATFQQIAKNVTAIKSNSTSTLFSIDNKSSFSLPSEAQAGEWVVSTNRIDTMASLINIKDELGNNIPFNLDVNGPNTQVSTLVVSGYKLSFIMPLSNIEVIRYSSGGTGNSN